jgi:hypothetical protein
MDTSEFGVASIDGAEVVVVAGLWNVDASQFNIANIKSASIVVLANTSVIPALWNSAFGVLVFEAFVISLAFLPVLIFAEVVAVSVGALEDLVFETLSRGLSAVLDCLVDAFWRSDVDSAFVSLCAKRKLVLAALFHFLASFLVVAEKNRSCLAAFGTSDELNTLIDLLLDANFTNSLDTVALLSFFKVCTFLLNINVALNTIFVFTTSSKTSSESTCMAISGLNKETCMVSISGKILAFLSNNEFATFVSCVSAAEREALAGLSASLLACSDLEGVALNLIGRGCTSLCCNGFAVAVWSTNTNSLL